MTRFLSVSRGRERGERRERDFHPNPYLFFNPRLCINAGCSLREETISQCNAYNNLYAIFTICTPFECAFVLNFNLPSDTWTALCPVCGIASPWNGGNYAASSRRACKRKWSLGFTAKYGKDDRLVFVFSLVR